MPSQLSERLSSLAADVSRAARPVPVDAIRRRAKARHQTRIALVAIFVGVATLSAAATFIASTGPGPAPVGETKNLPTEIADFRMPHEGELGWVLDDSPLAPSVFNPCGGADATLNGRIDARTESGTGFQGPGPDDATTLADQVLLFRTERDALAALQALASETLDDGCGWAGGYGPGYTDYGRLALIAFFSHAQEPLGYRHAVVTPRGNALIILIVDSVGAPIQDVDPVMFLADPLCATMGLCEERACYEGALPSPGDGQPMPDPVPCPAGASASITMEPANPSDWPGASPSDWPGMGPSDWPSMGPSDWPGVSPSYEPGMKEGSPSPPASPDDSASPNPSP